MTTITLTAERVELAMNVLDPTTKEIRMGPRQARELLAWTGRRYYTHADTLRGVIFTMFGIPVVVDPDLDGIAFGEIEVPLG